jgi:hypothetical protein
MGLSKDKAESNLYYGDAKNLEEGKMRAGTITVIAALLFAWPAQAMETPQDFMARLSAKYRDMDHWPRGYEPCAEFCEPALWQLVKHANDKDEAALDYDPFCQCQDTPPNLPVQSIRAMGQSAVDVTLHNSDTTWVLTLHLEDGHWKIADVFEKGPGLGSVKARLAKSHR